MINIATIHLVQWLTYYLRAAICTLHSGILFMHYCLGINLMHGSYGRAIIIIFEIAIEVTGEIWITMAPSSQGIKYYSLVLDWVRWDLEKQPRIEQRSVIQLKTHGLLF